MKRSINRTKLAVAMASVLAAGGTTTTALAVNLSDNGLGEVGLVPYYTVRSQIDTNISVVNTSGDYVVAFKIRFREGDNSRDARDFNVFLSPNDVWTATVTRLPDGDDDPTNDVPVLVTNDSSCTAPILQPNADLGGRPSMPFTSIAYDGTNAPVLPWDGGLRTIERAQEGHIEIIEMGVADPDVSQLARWAVHGRTQNCGAIANVYLGTQNIGNTGVCDDLGLGGSVTGNEAFHAEYCEPLNVLKVASNLIRVDAGVAGGMPVEMLANFYNPFTIEDYNNPAPQDLMEEPSQESPDLRAAFPPLSSQITEQGALTVGFANGEDAVSSLFMATDVINEYAIGGAGLAQTAWVINFPTKNFYVDNIYATAGDPNPFQRWFQPNGISCVNVEYRYWNREEDFEVPPPGGLEPSPAPIVTPDKDSICQETQTLNFGDVQLLGSRNNYNVSPIFDNGWMRLFFGEAGSIAGTNLDGSGRAVTFDGLPVKGFAIKSLENGVSGDNTLNYGIISEHAYLRSISQQ